MILGVGLEWTLHGCSPPETHKSGGASGSSFNLAVLISESSNGQSRTWLPAIPLYSMCRSGRGAKTATFVFNFSNMRVLNKAQLEAQFPLPTKAMFL